MGRKTQMNSLTTPELLKQVNPENLDILEEFLDYLRSLQRSEGTINGYLHDIQIRYSKVHKTFNASDYDSQKNARKYSLTNDVRYWAYLNDFLLVGVSNEDKN